MDNIIILDNVIDQYYESDQLHSYINKYPFTYIEDQSSTSNATFIYNQLTNYTDHIFFVEGKTEQLMLSIESNTNINTTTQNILISNHILLNSIPNINYKLSSSNWYKYIKKDQYMVPGYISGTININSTCNVPTNSLFIKCFRNEDSLYIGTYAIVNNAYVIDNLDVNTYYDIIMVDISRTIEQQVSSYRKPIIYAS